MPTLFEIFGLRFFFASYDHEPIHVHVKKGNAEAKVYLKPEIKIDYNHGLKTQDIKKVIDLVNTFYDDIVKAWEENDKKKM